MDPIEKRELKRQARLRLAAQRRRAGLLRGRVVVLSLICFTMLWGIVFVQMATGNDPVLAGKEKAATARAAASKRREAETADPRELETEAESEAAARAREEEAAVEAGPESAAEPEFTETEEAVEAEPETEAVEPEPLVTSQS